MRAGRIRVRGKGSTRLKVYSTRTVSCLIMRTTGTKEKVPYEL